MCVYEFVVYYMYKILLHAVWNKRDSTEELNFEHIWLF